MAELDTKHALTPEDQDTPVADIAEYFAYLAEVDGEEAAADTQSMEVDERLYRIE